MVQTAISSINGVKQFLEYMFGDARGHLELMFMGPDKVPFVKSYALHDPTWLEYATNRIEKLRTYENCYFGVCPRRESVERHAMENQIVDVPQLWVDVDGKHLSVSLEQQLEVILNFVPQPTLVIMSGNGYHCYWKLKEPYHVKDIDHKAYIKGILKGLSLALQGDRTFNLDRVLRVPFTCNRKDPNDVKEVKIVHFRPENVYVVEEFEVHRVEVDVEELDADEMDRQFQPTRLDSIPKHRELVNLAKTRLLPHIYRIQKGENWPEHYVDIIVDNLSNGLIEYTIEKGVEADVDLEDDMFIIHLDEENFKRIPLEPDAMKVIRKMHKLRLKETEKDHINLEDLPFALRVRIMNGTVRGGRSDLDYRVIYELRSMGYTPFAIKNLYENERYKIGEKYRERYHGRHNYLMSVIRAVDKKMENVQ